MKSSLSIISFMNCVFGVYVCVCVYIYIYIYIYIHTHTSCVCVFKYIPINIYVSINFHYSLILNHIYLTLGTLSFASHVKIFLFYTKFLSSNSNDANAIKDDFNITSLTLKVHFDSYVFEVLFYIFSPCKFFTHLFSSISKRKLWMEEL